MQVIKGVPVERWTRQQSVIGYWIIGNYFGKAVSNNKKVTCIIDDIASTIDVPDIYHCNS